MSELIPNNYLHIIAELKTKIKQAKTRAALSVNKELLLVYWEIGNTILAQQKTEGWGTKIIDRLSQDLKSEFPEMQGLSVRNIKYMRSFAEAYPGFTIVQQPAAQIQDTENQNIKIMQQAAAQLPWGHHQVILDKLKIPEERHFYIKKCIEHTWTRDMLVNQIESGLYIRQGALTNNFKTTIPDYNGELTQQLFKDPYNFDFLALSEKAKEVDLENALTEHVTKLLLELGDGFAFMGRQYLLKAGEKEYFLDLLFYHTKLRRHVVIELKIGEFMPEYVGKMNLYLGLADDTLKTEYDEPAIGLILCKTKDKIVAEYALRDTSKPIGIAQYKINQLLPDDIKSELPSIEQIEQKLDEEIENAETPLKEGIDKIKSLIAGLQTEKVEQKLDEQGTRLVFDKVLIPLYNKTVEMLDQQLMEYFTGMEITIYCGGHGFPTIEEASNQLTKNQNRSNDFKIELRLQGFKAAGVDAFDIYSTVVIDLDRYKYTCRFSQNNNAGYVKLYHQLLSGKEINDFVVELLKSITSEITKRLEALRN